MLGGPASPDVDAYWMYANNGLAGLTTQIDLYQRPAS